MKKSLGALLLLGLLLVGCSDNPALRLRYEAEKKLDRADRMYKQAQLSPDLATPESNERIIDAYRTATDFAFDALDEVSPTTRPVEYRELQQLAFAGTQNLGHMLYSQRHFDEAIDALNRLLKQPDLEPEQILTTRINLGRALQYAGKFDSALTVYNTTIDEFYPPVDQAGEVRFALFNLPMSIYRIKNMIGDSTAAEYERARAEAYYSDLATKYPDTKVATAAHATLASLYELSGDWRKSISQLEILSDTSSGAYNSIRLRIGDIYGVRLREYTKALSIYDSLIALTSPADTMEYPLLRYKIASVKLDQGKYDEARDILTDLKQNYRLFYAQYPLAQYAMARTFDLQKNWSRALVEYTYLVENYRGSDEAMDAYLYVADKLKKMGRDAESEEWYSDADKYYQQLAELGAGGQLEAKALSYRAEIDRIHGDWTDAADLMIQVHDRFPETDIGRRALVRAALVYRQKLDQPQVADSLMETLRASMADLMPSPEK